MASVGHVKDLPKSSLGVDTAHDFKPEYVTIPGKTKVLSEIRSAAKSVSRIYLASDPDREGEAIAWHVAEELRARKDDIYRVLFNEITQKAVLQAMQSPGRIDMDKVNAQQARRVLDRIVGYQISPLLWKKVRRGLSAGRVQSVAVRMICEREKEIQSFRPEEYWSIDATLMSGEVPCVARLTKQRGQTVQINDADQATRIVEALRPLSYRVANVEKKARKRNPPPPFITSTLQQDAARKLRFTSKKTMAVAQQLYEGVETRAEGAVGLITYMRTDSVRVSPDFQQETLQWIEEAYGAVYRPQPPNQYKSKASAQEAHEAIRPTGLHRHPDRVRADLTRDQNLLYKLIWERFIASQMTPAQYDVTQVEVAAGDFLLRISGAVLKFPGFTTVYTEGREEPGPTGEEENTLPPLAVGDILALRALNPLQHFTQPPPRYSEALLIHDLEVHGIGRPSTYAAILSTIEARKYVEKKEARFYPTPLGDTVNGLLTVHFPEVVDIAFTARMEKELDNVEKGETPWVETVRGFYEPFSKNLEKAQGEMRNVKLEEIPTDIACEKCGKTFSIKWGRFGRFLACSGYPECKNTKEFVETTEQGIKIVEKEAQTTDEVCEKCGKPLVIKTGRFGRFLACSGYPECKMSKPISTGVACPEPNCTGMISERRSKQGKVFYGCTQYPNCKFALWDRPVPKTCPTCGAPFLIEKRDRRGEITTRCRLKECGYEEGSS